MQVRLGAGHQSFALARNGAHSDTIVDFRSIYFGGPMSGEQEVPANNSDATGTITGALNFDRTRFGFRLDVTGIDLDGEQTPSPPDDMTDMHIHGGVPGVSGPPIFAFRGDAETAINAVQSVVTGGWDAAEGLSGSNLDNLLGGNTYFNIHTAQFGGGEIRGQILAVDQGRDRIDLREVNIGSLAALRDVTRTVQGDAVITTFFNGEASSIRLDGVGEAELRAAFFRFGGGGDQTIAGTGGRDDLFGGGGDDAISGGGGNDRMWGEAGDDTLRGQAGRDVLTGGAGADRLGGGLGADRFDFNALTESGKTVAAADRIRDLGLGDRIDLSTIDAMDGTGGNQAFTFIGETAFSAEGQVRVSEGATATVIAINTTGQGGAEMLIKVNGVGLAEGDFIL